MQPRVRAAGERAARLQKRTPGPERLTSGLQHGALSALAGTLAWLPTQALGLREGFWAAITAIAVAQSEFNAVRGTARDQFAGAAIGGAAAVAVVLALGAHVWSFAAAVMLAITGAWLLNVASAARLAGITATIIVLVPHAGTPLQMMVSRVGEVGWGVTVAILLVTLGTRIARRG